MTVDSSPRSRFADAEHELALATGVFTRARRKEEDTRERLRLAVIAAAAAAEEAGERLTEVELARRTGVQRSSIRFWLGKRPSGGRFPKRETPVGGDAAAS